MGANNHVALLIRESQDSAEVQQTLRQLFNVAAAMSIAVNCRLDAEPEMARFLEAVKEHPEQREFVVKLFLDSFAESFHMRHEPTDLLMYCMSDLRWTEVRNFIETQKDEGIRQHGRVCYNIWPAILESFEDNWRNKYMQEFTKMGTSRVGEACG